MKEVIPVLGTPAVIISSKWTGKYLVEYMTLKSDNEIELLKEEANALSLRPCSPIIQHTGPFEPFEEVDAWWVGSVCKILRGSKYMVYIKSFGISTF